MKKKFFLSMIVVIVAAFMVSCGNNGPAKPLSEVTLSYENDGQEIEAEGYLYPGNSATVDGLNRIRVGLYPGPAGEGDRIADVSMHFGKQANSIYMPKEYSDDDIAICDNESAKCNYKTKLKIVGKIKYTDKDWADDLKVKESDNEALNNLSKRRAERAQKDADKRKQKQNGDPNDYSFEIELSSITIVK